MEIIRRFESNRSSLPNESAVCKVLKLTPFQTIIVIASQLYRIYKDIKKSDIEDLVQSYNTKIGQVKYNHFNICTISKRRYSRECRWRKMSMDNYIIGNRIHSNSKYIAISNYSVYIVVLIKDIYIKEALARILFTDDENIVLPNEWFEVYFDLNYTKKAYTHIKEYKLHKCCIRGITNLHEYLFNNKILYPISLKDKVSLLDKLCTKLYNEYSL